MGPDSLQPGINLSEFPPEPEREGQSGLDLPLLLITYLNFLRSQVEDGLDEAELAAN